MPASTASGIPRSWRSRARRPRSSTRIRAERRTLLQQYQGEVARARTGEQILAGKLQELKGKALRREATAERTQELVREVELSRRLYESYLRGRAARTRPTTRSSPTPG